jgi:hypothetical protein
VLLRRPRTTPGCSAVWKEGRKEGYYWYEICVLVNNFKYHWLEFWTSEERTAHVPIWILVV